MKQDLPSAPAHLSAEAKRWWVRLVTDFDLEDTALLVLETALESFDRVRQCQEALKREGLTVADRYGKPRAHPLVAVERDARLTMLRALKALNLDLEPLQDGPGRPPK